MRNAILFSLPLLLSAFDCGEFYALKYSNSTLTLNIGPGNPDFEWGNFLILYWNARGIAKLAGVCFHNNVEPSEIKWWFKYLPRHVCPQGSLVDLFDPNKQQQASNGSQALAETCEVCKSRWRYPHECRGPWAHVLEEAQQETQLALRRWAVENNISLPSLSPWRPAWARQRA